MLVLPTPQLIHLSIAPQPRVTMQTSETALVVLHGEVDPSGKVNGLEVDQGTTPFVQRSIEAVQQWAFDSRESRQGDVPLTVVLLYRGRTDLPAGHFDFSVPVTQPCDSAPQPETIIVPEYPIDSTAEGTVTIEMQVDERGQVQGTEVIREVPSLTTVANNAVSEWRFKPAQHGGKPASGVVIAVISFPRPTMTY
jgi:outer membrane biosynthesis protein TonB